MHSSQDKITNADAIATRH